MVVQRASVSTFVQDNLLIVFGVILCCVFVFVAVCMLVCYDCLPPAIGRNDRKRNARSRDHSRYDDYKLNYEFAHPPQRDPFRGRFHDPHQRAPVFPGDFLATSSPYADAYRGAYSSRTKTRPQQVGIMPDDARLEHSLTPSVQYIIENFDKPRLMTHPSEIVRTGSQWQRCR